MPKLLASTLGHQNTSLRSSTPLTDEEIKAVAPSIFGTAKFHDRSARYTYIPTIEVLQVLRKEGFEPFAVGQTKTRDEERRDFAKHMVRMRMAGTSTSEDAYEVILLNSHDGASSYQLLAGLFRFACFNGLVVGDVLSDRRVPHIGKAPGRVLEGAYEVLDEFGRVIRSRNLMKERQLSRSEAYEFAENALELRYPVGANLPIGPSKALERRRSSDMGTDLWSTFNVVQENLIRGGQMGMSAKGRRRLTRPIRAIDSDVKLNRGLWTLAEGML